MPKNILIYVPAFGGNVTSTTFMAVAKLMLALVNKGIGVGLSGHSFPDIGELRNMAVTVWYDKSPEYSHMLFVDADMGFEPELVLDMLMFDEPMVGAVYPKRTYPLEWAASSIGNGGQVKSRGSFMQVGGLGMGCFLIRRDAITTMIEKIPELIDRRMIGGGVMGIIKEVGADRLIRAFDPIDDPVLGRISEDLSFCRRWREIGGEVWGAIGHHLKHVGPHTYEACYVKEVAKQVATPTGGGEFKVRTCKRGVFRFNPNDTFIGASLDNYGEWTDFELELLERFIKPGDTVLDVGANIGTHTIAFSKMVGSEGTVYAFEAQPRLFDLLRDNVVLNKAENVKGVNGVVGAAEHDGVEIADLPPDNVAFNFGALPVFASGGGAKVPMSTIDAIGLGSCSLIKIDAEGMEGEVLSGAYDTIRKFHPVLYFENNGENSDGVWQLLRSLGYEGHWSLGPYFNPNNHFKNQHNIWPTTSDPSANIIAVHKSSTFKGITGHARLEGPDDNWRKAMERQSYAANAAE